MRVTEENIVKEDGTVVNIVTKEVNSEDGWVHQNDLSTTGSGYGDYFKGKQVVKSFTINDPKIVQYVILGILIFLLAVNILLFVFNVYVGLIWTCVFTIPFVVTEYKGAKRRKMEREQRNNNQNNVNK